MPLPKPAPKPRTARDLDDDDMRLDELPPLDEDDALLGDELEEPLDAEPQDDDAYDDREADDLPGEDEPLELLDDDNDSEDAEHLDVGGAELETEDDEPLGADDGYAPGIKEEYDTDELTESPEDGGAEGLGEGFTFELDEQIPLLDEEEESGIDDLAVSEELLSPSFAPLPSSDPSPWSRLTPIAPRASLSAVAVRGAAVLAAGDAAYSVDASAQTASVAVGVEGPFSQVALSLKDSPQAALLTRAGALWLPDEAGAASQLPPPDGQRVTGIGWATAGLLALTARGVFCHRADGWRVVLTGATCALATSHRGDTLIARRDDETTLGLYLLARDHDALTKRAQISASPDETPLLAVNDGGIAIATSEGLLLARGEGELQVVERCAGVAALVFAGEGADAPLMLALTRDEGQRSYLARVDARGRATVVAEMPPCDEESEPGPLALGWDASRGVIWIATTAGLSAYGPRDSREATH